MIGLRAATEEDWAFLVGLRRVSMGEHLDFSWIDLSREDIATDPESSPRQKECAGRENAR